MNIVENKPAAGCDACASENRRNLARVDDAWLCPTCRSTATPSEGQK
jgi:hypothetical protein